MKYAVIGGDTRMRFLAQSLEEDGEVLDCTAALRDLGGTDCILLPLPAEKNGALFAPFMSGTHTVPEILSLVPDTASVFGGMLSAETRQTAQDRGLKLFDYTDCADFTVGNAALTAEAAVCVLIDTLPCALGDTEVLISGCGRIGKLLAHKLRALGADVTVMSDNAESRAMARAMGLGAIAPGEERRFDIAVNTAPGKMLSSLEKLGRGCLLLELASAPGGIDKAEAEMLDMCYISLPGLPAKYSPKSAGELMGRAVKMMLKERRS